MNGLRDAVAAHLPGVRFERVRTIEAGWDSVVYEVDGEWIVRVPRRPEVAAWLQAEARLLPILERVLPVPIPQFEAEAFDDIAFVAYRKLPGDPLPPGVDSRRLGAALGTFLAALHAFPVARACTVVERDWRAEKQRVFASFREHVLPLLAGAEHGLGESLIEEALAVEFEPALIHGDLGPEHVLHRGEEITGVIDWSDARVGDPAIDFAWTLYGTGKEFAVALVDAYGGVDTDVRARGLIYHRLGPWHEVLYGLEQQRPELVRSGLEGVRQRLRRRIGAWL